jgi:hypothetical protein
MRAAVGPLQSTHSTFSRAWPCGSAFAGGQDFLLRVEDGHIRVALEKTLARASVSKQERHVGVTGRTALVIQREAVAKALFRVATLPHAVDSRRIPANGMRPRRILDRKAQGRKESVRRGQGL